MKRAHLVWLASLALACGPGSSRDDEAGDGDGGSGGEADGRGGSGGGRTGGSAGAKGGSGGSGPSGGSAGTSAGGSGGTADSGPKAPGCMAFDGIVRDFTSTHPDFWWPVNCEGCLDKLPIGHKGMVEETLGPDKKPVLKPEGVGQTGIAESADSFKQWFNDTPGVNMNMPVKVAVKQVSAKLFEIGPTNIDGHFFPIDNMLMGNVDIVAPDMAEDAIQESLDKEHNHLLTLELHTELLYQGGKDETILVDGDDDVWVFINNKLAIDLGGLHGQHTMPETIRLDEVATTLGLEPGKKYPVDIFFADRQIVVSELRIATNVVWTGCAK